MHVFKVTKFDPEHFGARGYFGPEDVQSDHGPLEAAYLAAVRAFAEDTGVTELTIREPSVGGPINFGLEPHVEGHGLTGLFPPDLTGYHDGARVPLATGVALVKAMLRDNGAWCRLEVDGRFFVHVGYDQYMYVGSADPCDDAADRVRALGLFPEPIRCSPWDVAADELDTPRPADEAFWTELAELATARGTVLLQENFVGNASRWRRLRGGDVPDARHGLTPRASLLVWPELNGDVTAALGELHGRGLCTLVREDAEGVITSRPVVGDDLPAISAELADARGAMVISLLEGESEPLLAAVLPDDDGVVRVRWSR
ncbi:RNA-binding protein [Lentzea sp. NPDC060358]|uniref:RNA-binding protein n=1 Tax=Lentzea sp. NPDC060358 TaxID=3347103 RepID=UPI003669B173